MKKRMVIAIENQMLGNHFIAPGAMKFDPDEEYDVKWGSNNESVIGKARNLKREGDNITAEIEIDQLMFLDLDETAAMTFAGHVFYDQEKSEPGAVHISDSAVEHISLYDNSFGFFSGRRDV